MKRIFLIAGLALSLSAQAQFSYDYLKSADAYFKKGDYKSATVYYEKYLSYKTSKGEGYDPYVIQASTKKEKAKTSSREQAIYNLAESYRQLNFPTKSETYYKQAAAFGKDKFPLARYRYGKDLRANQKYEEAKTAFTNFLDSAATKNEYTTDAEREVKNLDFITVQLAKQDLNLYTVKKVAAPVNTNGLSTAPVLLNNETLLFTSTRQNTNAPKNAQYINKLYKVKVADTSFGSVEKVNIAQPADIHQGVAAITPDGGTLYLTRRSTKSEKEITSIFICRKTSDTSWSEPYALDSTINMSHYNAKDPAVTPDGKFLIYASDKPGGEGKYDLWYAPLDAAGTPGVSVNFGSSINTSFDERAPYVHPATGNLVFATNGRVGMGGLDLFQSKGTIGAWGEPENFGYPVNSIKDDIYFASTGGKKNILQNAYISSDRSSDCCLDLLSLNKVRLKKTITGKVVFCDSLTGATSNPLAGALVNVVDANGQTVYTQTTGADGTYSFVLDDFAAFKANASLGGYYDNGVQINPPADDESLTLQSPSICLYKPIPPPPPKVDTVIVMNNVYYAFGSYKLEEESFAGLNDLVDLMNKYPTMVVEVSAHTDDIGSDANNLKLSQKRAESCVTYLISKGIATERLEAKGYGESQPIAPNKTEDGKDNPEGRKQNRRTQFRVLHY